VMLALESNPYLSSRYMEDGRNAYWERLSKEHWNDAFETIVKGKEINQVPPLIPPCSIDIYHGIPFRVKLNRTEGTGDRITFSMHHGCADARGLMDAASFVLSIYRNLFKDPDYRPKTEGWYDRYTRKILEQFTGEEIDEATTRENRITDRWSFPYEYRGRGEPVIAIRRFPADRLESIQKFGREHGATVNDVIIAANIMAMLKIRNDPLDRDSIRGILTSADIRRHLNNPQGYSIENLSVAYMVEICTTGVADMITAVERVAGITREKKSGLLGLGDVKFHEDLSKEGLPAIRNFFREIHAGYDNTFLKNPVFSNVGIIDKRNFDPGVGKDRSPLSITDALFLPVMCRPPGFLMTVSTWKHTLSLACGYEEGPYSGTKIEEFLGFMDEYLP